MGSSSTDQHGLTTGETGLASQSQKPMKKEISESLNGYQENEWLKIMRSCKDLKEGLMATYTRAMQPDVFNHYKPRIKPVVPNGWVEDYSEYRSLKENNRAVGWKRLLDKYYGYIKKCDQIEMENYSDIKFLMIMKDFFISERLFQYAQQCEMRLNEFEEIKICE